MVDTTIRRQDTEVTRVCWRKWYLITTLLHVHTEPKYGDAKFAIELRTGAIWNEWLKLR